MATQRSKAEKTSADTEHTSQLPQYPVDMSSFLMLPGCTLDAAGVPYSVSPNRYYPTTIMQYALAHWNQYLATHDELYRHVFLAQAYWFVEHETRISEDAGGWLNSFPRSDVHTRGPWLSALTQGNAISVLVRAYLLTREEVFLEVAHRAVRTFHQDILDGGVSAPIGEQGVFFEEVAVYPAAHMLSGFIFALFGLNDYVDLTGDAQVEKLISRSLMTMHHLLDEFDLGYWTRSDLLHRRLASSSHLALQAELLEALSKYSGCDHCAKLALRWKSYQCRFGTRLRYFISSRCSSSGRALLKRIRIALFPVSHNAGFLRVCVPLVAFPVTGGIRSFLAKVAQVMEDIWQLEYLTHYVGPDPEGLVISRFGIVTMSPRHFPTVWLYALAGLGKLISLMRHGANYHVILPQDGVCTATFAALAGKLAGVRVVCIDHGVLTRLRNRTYPAERIQVLATKNWSRLRLFLARFEWVWYWPSLYLLGLISARFVDHFLIPGVAGDGIEEICKRLGVQTSRITRFATSIEVDRYIVLNAASKANLREKHGIPADAIVIAMVCRLAPEKGLDIALEAISRTLSALPPALSAQVRVVIAGDGPLRKAVEEDILKRGLSGTFLLWGEISTKEVISLLSLSDIFLYTSTRGACLSISLLEAMAAGCAVIASTLPLANVQLFAEGRGITVSPDDALETSMALVRLLNDLGLCRRMGDLARDYVAVQHSSTKFRRVLMRATCWSALDEILGQGKKSEPLAFEEE